MASWQKLRKRKRSVPPIQKPDTMKYEEALKDPTWDTERKLADQIMDSLRRLGLNSFKLDNLTKGAGSCFMIAVLQQLNREGLRFDDLREDVKVLARTMDPHLFRVKVRDFICRIKYDHRKVLELKIMFYIDQDAKAEAGEETKTWEEYWDSMLNDTEWADAYFIQATAWYIEVNLQIMDTSCKKDEPYYSIDGDLDDEGCVDVLYIGYVSNVHYQSLLVDYTEEDMDTDDSVEVNEESVSSNKDEVLNENSNKEKIGDQCPVCKKVFKRVLKHMKQSKRCKVSDEDIRRIEERSRNIRREKHKVHQRKFFAQWKKRDYKDLKENEKDRKLKSRTKLRDENYVRETEKIRESTAKSRQKLKENDPEGYKKRMKEDNESKKLRHDKNEVDRLRRFQEAVMYGPMFVCCSCHGKMFRCTVKILTNKIIEQIDDKIPIEDCIDLDVVTKVVTESRHCNWPSMFKKSQLEVGERFICDTCLRYLKVGKLPPRSHKNGLELHYTDDELKMQDLWLTELEGSLISQNIVFQKIFQLPRSRWTGLKDKVINVPISSSAINKSVDVNNISGSPRTFCVNWKLDFRM